MSKAVSTSTARTGSDCELDWSYTVRCINEWTDDELLSHLCSKAFTIPPRDYKPSTPFVSIKSEDGLTTIIPHRYRLPLLFIAKYQWETTFYTLILQDRQRWEAVRKEILDLSRLCQAVFLKARDGAGSGGMEKAWRCAMFDRVLTRFYKGMPGNSPSNMRSFLSRFGPGEYERNVLKYDWKRWVLKGVPLPTSLPTMRLMEKEINDGITAADFKKGLSKINNIWMLNIGTKWNPMLQPIRFIQTTDCNSSELTDPNLDKGGEPVELPHTTNLNPSPSPPPPPPPPHDTPAKRGREISEDDDNNDRAGKRVKMEEIIRSLSSQPCTLPDSSRPLGSGGVVGEEHATLPNFRVPRQTLLFHGWKRVSAIDASPRHLHREEEEEEEGAEAEVEANLVPTCDFDNSSVPTPSSPNLTSTPTPLTQISMNDVVHPSANPSTTSAVTPNDAESPGARTDTLQYHGATADDATYISSSDESDSLENSLSIIPPLSTSSLNEKTPMIPLSTRTPTSILSKSKEKPPESISTTTTSTTIPTTTTTTTATTAIGNASRSPKRIGPVPTHSAKGVMLRIRPPVSEPAHPPATKEGEGDTIDLRSPVVNSSSKITHESSGVQDKLPPAPRQLNALLTQSQSGHQAGDANREREKDKDLKMEEKRKNVMKRKRNVEKLKKSVGMQDSRPLSSSSSSLPGAPPNSTTNNNKNDKQSEITTPATSTATPNTPLDPSHVQVSNPNTMHSKVLGEGEKKKKKKKTIMKGKARVLELEKKSFGTQDPWSSPSSSSSLPGAPSNSTTKNNKNNNDGQGEMTAITATVPSTSAATLNTLLGLSPDHVDVLMRELDPKRMLVANSSGPSSSTALSSLPPSSTPSGLLEPAITNSGGGVAAAPTTTTTIGVDPNSESEAQQLNDRLRELIGKLELVKGVQDGDLAQGGCAVEGPDLVSQRKEKEKENRDCDLNVEMVDVSESGAMPGHVDAAVGADTLVTFKDMCVQTDEPAHVHRPIVASTTIAATPQPETDEPMNPQNLQPSSSSQPTDVEMFDQSMNTTSLSTIVDNLVSTKMLSMMQTLVKSGTNNNNTKTKPVETIATSTIAESDSDILRQPSPSPSSVNHSMDVYENIMANLLDELKTIKEEARCREQNEKEELLAMRQLHSAEVDALRRRLSYLESRNLSLGRWETGGGVSGVSGSGWRGSSSSMRVDPLDLDHQFMDKPSYHSSTPFRQQRQQQRQQLFGERSQNRHLQKGLGSCSSSTVNSEGELSVSNRPQTHNNNNTITTTTTTPQPPYTPLSSKRPIFSPEAPPPPSAAAAGTTNGMVMSSLLPTPPTVSGINNHYSGFSGNSGGGGGGHPNAMDLDDDLSSNQLPLPLPVKSQRKHHIMALARTHFSS